MVTPRRRFEKKCKHRIMMAGYITIDCLGGAYHTIVDGNVHGGWHKKKLIHWKTEYVSKE